MGALLRARLVLLSVHAVLDAECIKCKTPRKCAAGCFLLWFATAVSNLLGVSVCGIRDTTETLLLSLFAESSCQAGAGLIIN